MEMDFQMYMNDIVTTARNDMDEAGYTQMRTVEDVENQLSKPGTSVVFVNSVCGCAGGIARPAARHALDFDQLPDRLLTVFAGQDKEATEAVREKAPDFIPSSPSFILFKDGEVVDMIERHNIEGHETMSVIMDLQSWFMEHGKGQ